MQAMEEELKMLRSGVAVLLHRTTPVPGANAQLRRFCADLGRLLVASRPAEGYHAWYNFCTPSQSVTIENGHSHALYGAVSGVSHTAERLVNQRTRRTIARASERITQEEHRASDVKKTGCYPSSYVNAHCVMALSVGPWAQIRSDDTFLPTGSCWAPGSDVRRRGYAIARGVSLGCEALGPDLPQRPKSNEVAFQDHQRRCALLRTSH